jgi:hypothetical protein
VICWPRNFSISMVGPPLSSSAHLRASRDGGEANWLVAGRPADRFHRTTVGERL